jgi:hypothetical protein
LEIRPYFGPPKMSSAKFPSAKFAVCKIPICKIWGRAICRLQNFGRAKMRSAKFEE